MIKRLYVHNFRCLENFDLPLHGRSSLLLIGNNGSGKTTVALALEILQKIARGTNRVRDLVKPKDLSRGRSDSPMRFEIDVDLSGRLYQFYVSFELPDDFRELRISEEKLLVDNKLVYHRESSKVSLAHEGEDEAAEFRIDWHLVALPIIQHKSARDPLSVFKQWLSRLLILRPIPSLINGDSTEESLAPKTSVSDFGSWFAGLLAHSPAAYSRMDLYLKQVMPDLQDLKNPSTGKDSRSLSVQFASDQNVLSLPFGDLSDGEKCFMICALVLAATETYGPLTCFWDEPDNYLALSEVGHFILTLRKSSDAGGQLIATSHNPEAIRRFSPENTLFLHRNSHLEPTVVREVSEMDTGGDLISALVRGDLP